MASEDVAEVEEEVEEVDAEAAEEEFERASSAASQTAGELHPRDEQHDGSTRSPEPTGFSETGAA